MTNLTPEQKSKRNCQVKALTGGDGYCLKAKANGHHLCSIHLEMNGQQVPGENKMEGAHCHSCNRWGMGCTRKICRGV